MIAISAIHGDPDTGTRWEEIENLSLALFYSSRALDTSLEPCLVGGETRLL